MRHLCETDLPVQFRLVYESKWENPDWSDCGDDCGDDITSFQLYKNWLAVSVCLQFAEYCRDEKIFVGPRSPGLTGSSLCLRQTGLPELGDSYSLIP